jgi:hypothetical protein
MREKKYSHWSNQKVYINFEGFAISIYVFELYEEGEPEGTRDEVYERGLAYLVKKGIPFTTFPGYIEENYHIN